MLAQNPIFFCNTYGYSNLLFSSYRWVLRKWMSKNPNVMSNDDSNKDENDNDDDNYDHHMMII